MPGPSSDARRARCRPRGTTTRVPAGVCLSAFSTSARPIRSDAPLVAERARVARRLELELVPGRDGDRAELVAEVLGELAQVDGLPLEVHAPGVEPRQVEQILREPLEPVDLLAHRLEELRAASPRRAPRPSSSSRKPREREERRPQLVRRVADELPPRALELREAQPHPVEGARELPELVRAAVDDRLVEAPGGDPLGRASSRLMRRANRYAAP